MESDKIPTVGLVGVAMVGLGLLITTWWFIQQAGLYGVVVALIGWGILFIGISNGE